MYTRGKGWLLDRITITMGGFAAEKLRYGETSTGAQNDIEQATEMARRMVCEWGMSDTLGPISYGQKDEPIFLGKEIARHKDYSEETARHIDQEVGGIMSSRLKKAAHLLEQHEEQLIKLAKELLKQETVDDAEIRVLLGFPARDDISGDEELTDGQSA